MGGTPGDEYGVYVHVPFCARRCDYCDFATWTDRHHLMEAYASACVADIRSRSLPPATSVFFGGGTPSLLPAPLLGGILAAVDRVDGAEVTVECNPDTVTAELLAAYHQAGVNRLSFGVQSMQPHVLEALGRTHDTVAVERAVVLAGAAGFANYNLDLIYGCATEGASDWLATLEGALALDPPHVSAYALTVEPGTPLARRISAGHLAAPDDDIQADRYLAADEALSAAGLDWYEISNWARPGHECRHNLLYWRQGSYAGIGCAAHGHEVRRDGTARRMWNVRAPEGYISRIRAGASPEAGDEALSATARESEAVVLGLRTRAGVEWADDGGLVDEGLVVRGGAGLVLTTRGRLLANDVTARLLARSDTNCKMAGARR